MLNKEELIKETENAIKWIEDYVKNSNAKGVVVGCSGGKDSAAVLAMAVKAIRKRTCSCRINAMQFCKN